MAEHNATPPEGPGSSSARPLTAGRLIVRRPRGLVISPKEIYDEEEPQFCNCQPNGEQFKFPRGSRFCAMCGENRPMLKELQEQFMEEAAAAEDDPDDDLLRLFLLRRDDVIELAKKAFEAKNQGVLPDPLPVCQVMIISAIRREPA